MKYLRLQLNPIEDWPRNAVRVYTPGGEDITECLQVVTVPEITGQEMPELHLRAFVVTYVPPSLETTASRLGKAIDAICERELTAWRERWMK